MKFREEANKEKEISEKSGDTDFNIDKYSNQPKNKHEGSCLKTEGKTNKQSNNKNIEKS
jgi:hypothetical protein